MACFPPDVFSSLEMFERVSGEVTSTGSVFNTLSCLTESLEFRRRVNGRAISPCSSCVFIASPCAHRPVQV